MSFKETAPKVLLASSLCLSAGCASETIVQNSEKAGTEAENIELVGSRAVQTTTNTEISSPDLALTTDQELKMLQESVENNNTTTSTSISPTTSEATTLFEAMEPEFKFPREYLIDGNKIADITLTNLNGENLVNIPLFVVTDLLDKNLLENQLERGAILYVADPEVNPDLVNDDNGISQMGMLGEAGPPVNIFGHNMSFIEPDFDGNPDTEEGTSQQVFYKLDEAQYGAVLSINFTKAVGLPNLVFRLTSTRIVNDVQPNGEGSGMSYEKADELFNGDFDKNSQTIQLIKCTPDGSFRDRFVAIFEPTV